MGLPTISQEEVRRGLYCRGNGGNMLKGWEETNRGPKHEFRFAADMLAAYC
jgi:hypothetical protein